MNENFVSYLAFESVTARLERIIVRLCVLCFVLFFAFLAAVLGLFYMQSQYETVEISQEVTNDDGIALVSGMGDVYYDNKD